jgi:hypothetical protein
MIFPLVVAAWSPALAQQRAAATNSSAGPPQLLTLKERLGAKWMDEQRVNNCKVPSTSADRGRVRMTAPAGRRGCRRRSLSRL